MCMDLVEDFGCGVTSTRLSCDGRLEVAYTWQGWEGQGGPKTRERPRAWDQETSMRKLERTTEPDATNHEREHSAIDFKKTSDDTHLARKTAEDSGSGTGQSDTSWYWQTLHLLQTTRLQ